MSTAGWVSILLFLTVGAYAWGASGLLPVVFKDLIGKLLTEVISDAVAAHPLSRLRRPLKKIGQVVAWITFGSILIVAALLFVAILMIVLTPMLIFSRFRRDPDNTPPRFTPAGIAAMLRRIFTRDRRATRDADVVRFRRSARYATP